MILVTKWFGVFLVDKDKVVRHTLFGKDPQQTAEKLAAIQRGDVLPEEEKLAQKHIHVADPRLSKLGKPEVFDSAFIKPEDYGYTPQLMQKVMVELGKIRTREPLPPDRFIVQAVRAMDDTALAIFALYPDSEREEHITETGILALEPDWLALDEVGKVAARLELEAKAIARVRYMQADAMLKAREVQP